MDRHVIILGGGISGLSAAWRLVQRGAHVDILEESNILGGLAGTVQESNYYLDIGPHSFFSEDAEMVKTVLELFDNKLEPTPRSVKFYYKNRYLDYPLTAFNVLFQMGIGSGFKAALSFLKSKFYSQKHITDKEEDKSVEDWAIANFGEHLYRTFFKPYTEQFWKLPCSELSSCAIPTHTRMSFINTCRLLLHRKVTKRGDSLIEREALPTYYPKHGFGEIAGRIAKHIKKSGDNVHISSRAEKIKKLHNGKIKISYKQYGQEKEIEGDCVISTIPIISLIKMIEPSPSPEIIESAERLHYQALIVLGMITEKQNILNCSYTYMLGRPYNRITEMNKFSVETSPQCDNILAVEFTCDKDDAIFVATKEELFEISIGALEADEFISREEVKGLILVKAPYAYPVYRKDYAQHLKNVLDYLNQDGHIIPLGRTGEFIYMDVDRCIKKAFDCVNNL